MKKILNILIIGLLMQFSLSAQDFVLNNPVMTPNPGIFPGGTETMTFDFYVAGAPFTFSSNDLSNDYATITFSFTKMNPTGLPPTGTGAALFTWVLSNNGGVGTSLVYTWTGRSRDVTVNQTPTQPKYKITFSNVPITAAATQNQTDVRVAGQFTDPGNAPTGNSGNNSAVIATYTVVGGQQIAGSVYIDKDVSDGDIHRSFGLPNDKTNASGLLFANLVSGAVVVATVPVSANGEYLFDNVPLGTYTVQVSSMSGVVGAPPPLPANYIRTGEFIGAGPGNDGSADGISAPFTISAGTILNNVDFGIKAGACVDNKLYTNPIAQTGYYGGFELAQNFFPTGTNLSNGPGRIYAITPLAPANYSITTNPNSFDNTLSSFNSLGGTNQMVAKPASNQIVYSLIDSAGKIAGTGQQATFISFKPGSAFRGWLAKASNADAVIKIKIYDADVPSRVFSDVNINLTGAAGSWLYFSQDWMVNYGIPNTPSLTKKVRLDIISVNGAPISLDELCFVEPAQGPVPIVLADFTVQKNACTANLIWKTSSEGNSDRFEVEVSTVANPVYASAGTVMASGNSSTTKTYQLSYPMQAGVVYYFRLKMIDVGGAFKYSDTRSSSCSKGGGGIVIAPNPAKDNFTIQGMENGKNIIMMYAANGQLVKTQTSAINNANVNISYMAPGVYTVKVTSAAGNIVVSKLIKY